MTSARMSVGPAFALVSRRRRVPAREPCDAAVGDLRVRTDRRAQDCERQECGRASMLHDPSIVATSGWSRGVKRLLQTNVEVQCRGAAMGFPGCALER